MKIRTWIIGWLVIVLCFMIAIGGFVYKIDPFFHYHKPYTDEYYYRLNNERSQNDGISRNFDYDALITGSSMAANFRTSFVNEIFECNSIKVSYQGGSFKELGDNVERALEANSNIRIVIRSLEYMSLFDKWDHMRDELGKYPLYLYDNNPFNDVEYLFNRDIIFDRAYMMQIEREGENFIPGITPFDEYSRWQDEASFGFNVVCPDGFIPPNRTNNEREELTDEEKAIIRENVEKNITSVADKYPDVDFYYFYPPYSIVWWSGVYNGGQVGRQIEAEKYFSELIIPHHNIHLFSFNNRIDITADLNNYKDSTHYASWINDLFIKWMHEDEYRLTEDNIIEYINKEYDIYSSFDYKSINNQLDYEADYYAAALLNEELTGAQPIFVDSGEEYVIVDFNSGHNYLEFYYKGNTEESHVIDFYSIDGEKIGDYVIDNKDTDMHQYVIDLSVYYGVIKISGMSRNAKGNNGFYDVTLY